MVRSDDGWGSKGWGYIHAATVHVLVWYRLASLVPRPSAPLVLIACSMRSKLEVRKAWERGYRLALPFRPALLRSDKHASLVPKIVYGIRNETVLLYLYGGAVTSQYTQ